MTTPSSNPPATAEATPSSRLAWLPVSLFASCMGLGGLGVALARLERTHGWPSLASDLTGWLAMLVFTLLLLAYGFKALRFPEAVRTEFLHPVKMSFVPTLSISLLVLSVFFLPTAEHWSAVLWWCGMSLHALLTLLIVSQWMFVRRATLDHLNPAWFIPVVGNVVVPLAGVHHAGAELSWLFFSVGFIFWLLLQSVMLSRMLFHPAQIPPGLLPTYFIMIAPPSVGYLAWTALNPEPGVFGRLLYYTGLFMTLLLLVNLGRFLRLPFAPSWWAYSFPLAAIAIATQDIAARLDAAPLYLLGLALTALAALVIGMLLFRTVIALGRGQLLKPD